MLTGEQPQNITQAEQRIRALTVKLAEAKSAIQQWSDANQSLSRSAAEARASNQGSGRGLLGGLLGSKFRGAMRSAAASSNAAIAKDVAAKRARIGTPHSG
jgi:cell division septum initiation protein DivIVA